MFCIWHSKTNLFTRNWWIIANLQRSKHKYRFPLTLARIGHLNFCSYFPPCHQVQMHAKSSEQKRNWIFHQRNDKPRDNATKLDTQLKFQQIWNFRRIQENQISGNSILFFSLNCFFYFQFFACFIHFCLSGITTRATHPVFRSLFSFFWKKIKILVLLNSPSTYSFDLFCNSTQRKHSFVFLLPCRVVNFVLTLQNPEFLTRFLPTKISLCEVWEYLLNLPSKQLILQILSK